IVLALVPRPGRPGPGPRIDPFETLEDIDVIVSTVGLALLSALFVVYAKTYADTGARSALGLIVVLAAFLFEGVLTSPILFGAFGHALGELGPFVLVAHGFRTAAFAAFLYLTLQCAAWSAIREPDPLLGPSLGCGRPPPARAYR